MCCNVQRGRDSRAGRAGRAGTGAPEQEQEQLVEPRLPEQKQAQVPKRLGLGWDCFSMSGSDIEGRDVAPLGLIGPTTNRHANMNKVTLKVGASTRSTSLRPLGFVAHR